MQCCNMEMRNWSTTGINSTTTIPHYYCPKCNSHVFRGKHYTAEEWFFYINEETHEEYRRRQAEAEAAADQDRLESLHAHEQINHSDPEK